MKRLQDGKDVTESPHLWQETDRVVYEVDEAAAMLPERDVVNVKVNNVAGVLIGADWKKSDVIEAMSKAYVIEASGPMATRMGFGLYFLAEGGNRYFAETRDPVEAATRGAAARA